MTNASGILSYLAGEIQLLCHSVMSMIPRAQSRNRLQIITNQRTSVFGTTDEAMCQYSVRRHLR